MLSRFNITLLILLLSFPASAATPERVQQANLNESQITISWVTALAELGKINYGLTTGLGTMLEDDLTDDVHHITLTNLQPETTYYYDIISGATTDNNNGQHYSFKTASSLANPPVGSDLVYGQVFKSDGKTPAKGAVVYIRLQDNDKAGSTGESALVSVRTDDNGYWFTNLVNIRTTSNTIFAYSAAGDNLSLQVEGGSDGSVSRVIDTKDDSPAPFLILASDTVKPYLEDLSPSKNASNVKPDTKITLHIKDDGSGVDKSSIILKINSQKVTPNITGSVPDYLLEYTPASPFPLGTKVIVDITAQDLSKNMLQATYSFTIIGDTQAPYTLYHYPAKNETNVPVGTMVMLHVLDDISGVDKASIVMKVKGVAVTPVITGSNKDYTLVYNPSGGFKYGEQATISITAKDLSQPANILTEEYSFSLIQDKAAPYVVDRFPKRDAVDVSPDTNIIIYLKDDLSGIDKNSISLLINDKPVSPEIIGISSYFILMYTPKERFGYSQKVSIDIQARDLALPPNIMSQEKYSFTTSKDPDVTAPYTDGHSPAKGASNVPVDATIVFHLKDIQSGVDKSSIKLQVNGITVTPIISGTTQDFTIAYKPQIRFEYNQTVRITINAKDISGNMMTEDAYSFTTEKAPDTSSPYTSGHFPVKNATNVSVNATITVHIKDDNPGVEKSSIGLKVNNSLVSPTISGDKPDYTISYKPLSPLGYNQVIQISIKARDLAGNIMPEEIYSFTTELMKDTTPPYTSGHQPAKGAINVATNTTILIHVRDDGMGVNKDSIEVLINNAAISPVISGTKTDYIVSYKPAVNFGYEQQVQVIVRAKDLAGNIIPQESYSFRTVSQPITSAPSLSWTGEPGYENDAINPDTCNLKGTISYRIKYTDPNNIPPRSGYPSLFIYLNGKQLKNTVMSVADIKDTNYRDGKIYLYSYTIAQLGSYSYKIDAMNQKGTAAVGVAAKSQNGPVVLAGNNPPQLKYFYTDAGVSPKSGNLGTKFEFRVIYSDEDNHLPGANYPILCLALDGKALNPAQMEAVDLADTNVIDAKAYRVIIPLTAFGSYTYRFEALDSKGMKAIGEASISKPGPIIQRVNTPPILELGFDDGKKGVNPTEGKRNTIFEWRVKYTDAENDPPLSGYPKIYIYKAGKQYLLLTMTPVDLKDNIYTDGKIYSIKKSLVMAANYSCKFSCMDIMRTLTELGPIQGPLVSTSAPQDGIEMLEDMDVGCPYPNPVFDVDSVSFFGIPDGSSLRLYNLAGELVFEGVYDGLSWTPPSSLSSGIYIYLIEIEGRVIKGKLGIVR